MDSIRVSADVKKIEVNAKGEYICIPLKDQSFINKLYDLNKLITSDETKKKFENNGTFTDEEMLEKTNSVNNEFLEKIDDLFGKGACKKIFSEVYEDNENAVPGLMMILDFLEQILPLMEKFADDFKNNDTLNKLLSKVK